MTIFLLLFFSNLKAQENIEVSLDTELQNCMQNCNYTTFCMNDCTDMTYHLWDNELNRQYHLLKENLSKKEFSVLRNSQRKWIAFRDAEIKVINEIYYNMDGTMWTTVRLGELLNLVKQRTKQLIEYNRLINDEGFIIDKN